MKASTCNGFDLDVRSTASTRFGALGATSAGGLAGRIMETVDTWRRRAATRRRLLALDERMLKDIGVSRADAEREGNKQFWQP